MPEDLRPVCFNANCEKRFASVDNMVPVAGSEGQSPRHFCEDCAERVRRGPPLVTDGGTDPNGREYHDCPECDATALWEGPDAGYWTCDECGRRFTGELGDLSVMELSADGGAETIRMTDDGLVMPEELVGTTGTLTVEWPSEKMQSQTLQLVEPGIPEVCSYICRGVMPPETAANDVPGSHLRIGGTLYEIVDDRSGGGADAE